MFCTSLNFNSCYIIANISDICRYWSICITMTLHLFSRKFSCIRSFHCFDCSDFTCPQRYKCFFVAVRCRILLSFKVHIILIHWIKSNFIILLSYSVFGNRFKVHKCILIFIHFLNLVCILIMCITITVNILILLIIIINFVFFAVAYTNNSVFLIHYNLSCNFWCSDWKRYGTALLSYIIWWQVTLIYNYLMSVSINIILIELFFCHTLSIHCSNHNQVNIWICRNSCYINHMTWSCWIIFSCYCKAYLCLFINYINRYQDVRCIVSHCFVNITVVYLSYVNNSFVICRSDINRNKDITVCIFFKILSRNGYCIVSYTVYICCLCQVYITDIFITARYD